MIFDTQKTSADYAAGKLFLTGDIGLVDTIHKPYKKVWSLYNEMRALDWKESEFSFDVCALDFENGPKTSSEMMIENLTFQWESDSVAAQSILYIIAPLQPCTEIWAAEQRIADNEQVHANTYSEIVRMSFKDPSKVLDDILAKSESFKRLTMFGRTLKELRSQSIRIAYERDTLGKEPSLREVYTIAIKLYFVLLCLERIQFMASFAITFTICQSGLFQPIGMAVKKIAQDELEIHCEYRKEVLIQLMKTELGKEIFEELKPFFVELVEEVTDSELTWTNEYNFRNGRELVGTNKKFVSQWVLFCVKDVVNFAKIKTKYTFPRENPMPHLEPWLNMNKNQAAPQEQDNAAYKLNIITRNDQELIYNF